MNKPTMTTILSYLGKFFAFLALLTKFTVILNNSKIPFLTIPSYVVSFSNEYLTTILACYIGVEGIFVNIANYFTNHTNLVNQNQILEKSLENFRTESSKQIDILRKEVADLNIKTEALKDHNANLKATNDQMAMSLNKVNTASDLERYLKIGGTVLSLISMTTSTINTCSSLYNIWYTDSSDLKSQMSTVLAGVSRLITMLNRNATRATAQNRAADPTNNPGIAPDSNMSISDVGQVE